MDQVENIYFKKERFSAPCCGSCKKVEIVHHNKDDDRGHILVLAIEACDKFKTNCDLSEVCEDYEPRSEIIAFTAIHS